MSRNTVVNENLDKKMNEKLSANSKTGFENRPKHENHEDFEETPTWAAVVTVLGYAILSALGWLRDFLRHIGFEEKKTAHDPNPKVCSYYDKIKISIFYFLQRILYHFIKVMNVFIHVIYIHVFVMYLINR
jgi:hypothetical protein